MFKNTIRAVGLCLLLGVVAIPGVWANWVYCDPQESAQGDVGVKIGAWPEDVVLPSKPEDTEAGQNYLMLLEAILHSKKSGLNPTDLLENAIWNEKKNSDHLGLLYSSQNVTGGNQAHLFDKDTANGTASLLFAIESIEGSKTEYYVYMYKKKDAQTAILQNNLSKTPIFAYRALVKYENGKWSSAGVLSGYGYVYEPPGDSFNGLKTDSWVSY